MLDLANQARAQAGLPQLKFDPTLRAAARQHSELMASQGHLSHDLPGEPALPQRLARVSTLELSAEGENVGFAPSADDSHRGFMGSPHHRANLLDADFNLAGIGVVRSGSMLYVTQDFAKGSETRAASESAHLVLAAVNRFRQTSGLPPFASADGSDAHLAACAMATADSVKLPTPHSGYLIRYTTSDPAELPSGVGTAVGNSAVKTATVGTCYSQTATYPGGTYWVALFMN